MPNVSMPNGDVVFFPDDMPKEQIKGLIATKFPHAVPEPGFLDRASQRVGERIKDVGTQLMSGEKGDQNPLQNAWNIAGDTAAMFGDVAGEGLRSAYGMLPDAVTGRVNNAAKATADYAGSTSLGQKAKELAQGYGQWSEAHPQASKLIDSTANIAFNVPLLKAAPAVGEAAVAPVKATGRAAANMVTPAADAGLAETGKLAQKYGIPLSLDQISKSRVMKNVQKVSQELPFSGQAGFRDSQMKAFNKALFKTVGVDAERFTPETMAHAFEKVGGEFDALTKGKDFNIGGTFIDDLASTLDDVHSTYGTEAAGIYQKEATKVLNDFSKGDVITGELIGSQRSRINRLARNAHDPNIKGALLDLENNIVDGITSADPKLQAALSTAKQRYKNLIVLEPIANKAKGGMISPSLLNNRVSQVYKRAHTVGESGEIGDLARVGHELLPELGGSDTTQKMLTAGAAGAIASNPTTVAPIAGAAGANRVFQAAVNRNQALVAKALKNAPTLTSLGVTATPQGLVRAGKPFTLKEVMMLSPAVARTVIDEMRQLEQPK